ncbi:MAG: hypothetical protein B6I37_00740 [Desulfobacteraceae bacterium 4572_35.2]|nr:MAG: hypothetical protein B6I37_00740 [Desulfobacteraceae bacterium 4572_35.2]
MSQMRNALLECQTAAATLIDGVVCQRYCLPADFVGFDGHFPDYPIVPAVVQILMAQIVAEQHLVAQLSIGAIDRSKFHRQLKPFDLIDTYCQPKQVRGKSVIDCQLKIDDEVVAAFWLVLNGEDQG